MDAALKLPGTTSIEIHQYGRQLLMAKQVDEALQVFQYNAERNGDAWPVHVGLARAYMAKGGPNRPWITRRKPRSRRRMK